MDHRTSRAPTVVSLCFTLCAGLTAAGCGLGSHDGDGFDRYDDPVTDQHITLQHDLILIEELVISAGVDSVGPWALAKPRAVFEADDGRIYVLDSDWKHVFVFGSDGAPLDRLGGGYGSADGEMVLPVDMDTYNDTFYVLDYELDRVSVFDLQGHFRYSISLPYPGRYIAVSREGLWVQLMQTRSAKLVDFYDHDGSPPSLVAQEHITDSPYLEHGILGTIGRLREGNGIAYVHGSGAFLQFVRSPAVSSIVSLGSLSEWKPLPDDPSSRLPVEEPVAVLTWEEDRVMIISTTLTAPRQMTVRIIEQDGTLVTGSVFRDMDRFLPVDAGRTPGTIFVSFLDGPARVVKYSIHADTP